MSAYENNKGTYESMIGADDTYEAIPPQNLKAHSP